MNKQVFQNQRWIVILFFEEVKKRVPIHRIYYPGSGDDAQLEGIFPDNAIVDVDCHVHIEDFNTEVPGPHYIIADYARSPFRDYSFDAIFMQAIHAEQYPDEMEELLRVLKPYGVYIQ